MGDPSISGLAWGLGGFDSVRREILKGIGGSQGL